MAFKKKAEGNAKSKSKGSLSDVRIFAVIMLVAFIAISVLIGFGIQGTKETKAEIFAQKDKYAENLIKIDNLKKLQKQSDVYEGQKENYDKMIPATQNVQDIMIEMEKRVEENHCVLRNFTMPGEGGNASAGATTPSGLLQEKIVNLDINGKYADIVNFMKEITEDDEFMRIDSIHLVPQEDEMSAQITVVKFSKA